MATVTGFTAERMLVIENETVVDGRIEGDDLILVRRDDVEINAGNVRGPQGPMGLGPGMIPGEIRLFAGATLPDPEEYSTWVWANGAAYLIADHPIAAAHIDDAWRTFDGAADPGVTFFRVPDLRGLVPAGMDTMPAGSAANRMTRTEADDIAGISGEELHDLVIGEIPSHTHTFSGFLDGTTFPDGNMQKPLSGATAQGFTDTTNSSGGGNPHENVQPTVFVPYIVCLDGSL